MRVAALLLLAAACGGSVAHEPRATTGVRAYLATLRGDDARAAWELLAPEARRDMSYDDFAAAWKATGTERARQAAQLEEGLRGAPNLTERATVTYADGKTVALHHDGGRWRLDSGLVSRTTARTPLDAIDMFARAVERRDFEAALAILTSRRRDGIARFVAEFAESLRTQKSDEGVTLVGADRAELAWDQDGTRYKVVLLREGDEWRVDDFDIQPAPTPSP